MNFDEGYSYEERETTVEKESPFFFLKLEPFTKSIFNSFIIEKEKLPITLLILSITPLKAESNGNCFSSAISDNNSPPF